MAPAVSVPQHKLFESPTSRSIHVGDWQITSTTTPISSAGQCDELQATLGFTLPEMIFGNNSLKLEHRPSGWVLEFTAEGALKCVRNGEAQPGDGAVKVEYADKWLSSRYMSLLNVCPALSDEYTGRVQAPVYLCPRQPRQNSSTGRIPPRIQGILPAEVLLTLNGQSPIPMNRLSRYLLSN